MDARVIAPSTGGVENEDNDVPLPEIETHVSVNDISSEVTMQSQAVPIAATVPEDSSNIGQPATPPLRSYKHMDEAMFDEGYDSDGEMGPFFDQVMAEGALVSEEEEIIGKEYALDAPQNTTRNKGKNNETPQ